MLYQHNYVLTAQQEILQLDQTQGIIHGAAPVKKGSSVIQTEIT